MIRLIAGALCLLAVQCATGICRADAPPVTNPGSAHTLTGDIRTIPAFHSKYLHQDREIILWLPPGYETRSNRRYPVLYMHDGQNLFDGATSFIPGHEWCVDETATRLVEAHAVEPLIIVGVYNGLTKRIDEYTPTSVRLNPQGPQSGGQADRYGRFLVEELKPFIDSHYHTKTDAADTGICGSSLGGLVSLYLGLKYPNVYGKIACLSTSVWWDNDWIVGYVGRQPRETRQRIWQDVGTAEEWSPAMPKVALPGNRILHKALLAKGWQEGVDYRYVEAEGASHNEDAWAKRVGPMLEFLFPASR